MKMNQFLLFLVKLLLLPHALKAYVSPVVSPKFKIVATKPNNNI